MRQYGQVSAVPDATLTSLVFRAGPLLCALPLDEVVETMRPLPTRPLAGTPPFVLGISVLRGVPTPVLDMARLLAGEPAEIDRYVAVRTERGPVALAIGQILGIRDTEAGPAEGHPTLVRGVARRFVAGVGTIGVEPLLLLQSMRAVPDEVWEAAAAVVVPS
jgi:purine-binding chemotaxis protein CheW